ncbi:MAG TPA: glycosyltransferase family 4 protein [candidate division Zixibacteria bacterium]|nr:glycosyltransferase family 4 protein [candidate division Zixibacteria bacterium]
MKVLIITQHFPPERGAVRRLFEFARYFVQNGIDVSVMTAIPNYPDGIVPEKYRGKFFYAEEMDGIKVYRSWVLPAANSQPTKRMVGFITFLVSVLINQFKLKQQFDLVLASTPPVTSPVIGWMLSKIRRCKFVIEVRDLQPESGEDFGNLKGSIFTRMIRWVMHKLYRKADRIVSVTDGISRYMDEVVGISRANIATIKSGVGKEFIDSDSNGIRRRFGWEEKFLVLYSGTLGWVRPLETVIEAARQLVDQPNIHFAFIGDGQKREALQQMVSEYGLKNVSFIGLQPLETIPYFLKAADVLIESLKEVNVAKMAFPSKMFEYMASGRPIVFGSRRGEAIDELRLAGGALTYASESPEELAQLVLKMYSGEIETDQLGAKYRLHIINHHRREMWAGQYLNFLENV